MRDWISIGFVAKNKLEFSLQGQCLVVWKRKKQTLMGHLVYYRPAKAVAHTRLFEAEFSSPTVVMLCHIPGSLCSGHKTSLLFPKFVILQEKKITLDAVNIKGKGEVSL